jgi:hypothetical protein
VRDHIQIQLLHGLRDSTLTRRRQFTSTSNFLHKPCTTAAHPQCSKAEATRVSKAPRSAIRSEKARSGPITVCQTPNDTWYCGTESSHRGPEAARLLEITKTSLLRNVMKGMKYVEPAACAIPSVQTHIIPIRHPKICSSCVTTGVCKSPIKSYVGLKEI